MKATSKLRKTKDGKPSYLLSKVDVPTNKEIDLIDSIIKALELSYQNNVDDLPVDFKSTIRLLYEKIIKLRSFPNFVTTDIKRFKLAEASNDLAMAFYKSYQCKNNLKDLDRAETFYKYSIKICPLSIAYYNYFSLLKATDKKKHIEHLYKDMLEAQDFKVSKKEITEIFF